MIHFLKILFLTHFANNLIITNSQTSIYSIPNNPTTFSSFKLVLSSTDTTDSIFNIIIDCSSLTPSNMTILYKSSDLCLQSSINGTSTTLNTLLSKLKISSKLNSKQSITTSFSVFDANSTLISQNMITFNNILEIPLVSVNNLLQVDLSSQEASQTFTAIQIDPLYCSFFGSNGLHITPLIPPSQISYYLNSCTLSVGIILSSGLPFPIDLPVSIQDNNTGLSTSTIHLTALTSKGNSTTFSRMDFWIFVCVFLVLICCFILMLHYANSKAIEYDKAKQDANEMRYVNTNDLKQQTIEMRPNVLSDSILTWNQQLMSLHQKKNLKAGTSFENNVNDIFKRPTVSENIVANIVIPEQTPNKPFEDISEINSVDFHHSLRIDPVQNQDSFFDE